jgi:glycosyltransferase involved in cell wall biosynthesis
MANSEVRVVVVTTMASLPAATLAVTSFLEFHPRAKALVAVADARFHHIEIPDVSVLHTADLSILLGEATMLRLATSHEGEELVRALRPQLLATLLRRSDMSARGAESGVVMVSLPDDAVVEGELRSMIAGARRSGAAIVPTRLTDIPADGKLPDASDLSRIGRFDQDFFAVTIKGLGLMQAWADASRTSAHISIDRLDAVRHPWLDSLAVTHGALLLRESGLSISYLNAEEPGRSFEPLLFRYTGFNATRPWIVSERAGEQPRVRASEYPWLADRLRQRAQSIESLTSGYGFDLHDGHIIGGFDVLDDGMPFNPIMRRAYRVGCAESARHHLPDPPNPFLGPTAEFFHWLNEPFPNPTSATRYLRAVYDLSPSLRNRFPDPNDEGIHGFVAWARARGREQFIPGRMIPPEPLPDLDRVVAFAGNGSTESAESVQSAESKLGSTVSIAAGDGATITKPATTNRANPVAGKVSDAPGVNLIGLLRAELGIGTAGRLLLRCLERTGLAHSVVVDDATAHRQEHPLGLEHTLPAVEGATRFPVSVVALNADAMLAYCKKHPQTLAGTKTVGLWFWETEVFPSRFHEAFHFVDEIWVATEHVRHAISAATNKPVHKISLGAPTPQTDIELLRRRAEKEFEIDHQRFVVMFCFDYASVAERKNPWGAVAAYIQAFPREGVATSDGKVPLLILKTINADRFPLDAERLRFMIANRRDIIVLDDYLSSYLTTALLSRADCYLSLHRAEGWGLTIAEAMAVEVPVVATGYSGSCDLIDDSCAFVVPYSLVEIPNTVAEYAGTGQWAEPDVGAAAQFIVAIASDKETAKIRAKAGYERIANLAQSFSGANAIHERVVALTRELHAPVPIVERPHVNEDEHMEQSPTYLNHPGLGPVVLPPSDFDVPVPTGVRGTVRSQLERAIKFEVERRDVRDHQRAAAIVDELSATRSAVRDFITVQRIDQETLTNAIRDTGRHIASVEKNHEALHAAVVDIGRHTHQQSKSIDDIQVELSELRIRIEQLSRSIEQLVLLQRPPSLETSPDVGH